MKNFRILKTGILQKFLIIAFLLIASKSSFSDDNPVRSGVQADDRIPSAQAVAYDFSPSYTPFFAYIGSWDYREKASRAENILLAKAELDAVPFDSRPVTNSSMVSYTTDKKTETYRELSETSQPVYIADLTKPQHTGETTIGVAPYGYLSYQEPVTVKNPIRDFRTDYWHYKYYPNERNNAASYKETYLNSSFFTAYEDETED